MTNSNSINHQLPLLNKHILLGITGSIAAYKSPDIVRRLREYGAEVRVVMTPAAKEFITPSTLQAVSGNPVRLDLFDAAAEAAMGHIELARWADIVIVAPASANFIAQLAHGMANDLLTTLCLVCTSPIIIAPAMNQCMWLNKATQINAQHLIDRNIQILGPAEGSQACGELGFGRMLEPMEIVHHLMNSFEPLSLNNKKVVITAGPTQEKIDPVRYISNYSSGKMGYALAAAANAAGAEVILISGPTHLATPQNVKRIDVNTAEEMLLAALESTRSSDIFISVAAVADYTCATPHQQKIKKSAEHLTLELTRTPDILATISKLPKRPYIVGFAAETEHLLQNAQKKLLDKNVDMIIANDVGQQNIGFGSDYNQVTAVWKKGQQDFKYASKREIARVLIKLIADQLNNNNQ